MSSLASSTFYTFTAAGTLETERWNDPGLPDLFFEDLEAARRSVLSVRDDGANDSDFEWNAIQIERIEILPLTKENILKLLNGGPGAIVERYEIVEIIT